MLLLWYTPPRAGAQRQYADWLMQWRDVERVRDDEDVILLLLWSAINKEIYNGTE
jgi:hypothetical protein